MVFVIVKPEENAVKPSGGFVVRRQAEARPVTGTEAQIARAQERFATGLTTAAREAPVLAANVSRGAQRALMTVSDLIGEGVKRLLLGVVDPGGIRREVNPVFREFEEASLENILPEPEAPIEGSVARNVATRIGNEIGATALPTGAVLRAAARGAQLPVTQFAARAPGTFTAGEMAAAAGAGAAAETLPGRGPLSELLKEVAGGTTPFAFATTLENMFRAVAQRSRGKAAAKVQLAAKDPETSAQLLSEPTPEGMTAAQATGDPGLISLERSIVRAHDRGRNRFLDRQQQLNETLIGDVERALQPSSAGIDVTREFMQGRIDTARNLLDQRAEQASDAVRMRIERLGAGVDEIQAQKVVYDELDRFYIDARAQETELYDNVPMNVVTPRIEASRRFRDAFRDEEKDDIALLPTGVRELFRAKSGSGIMEALTGQGPRDLPNVRIGRLQNLRSSVLNTAREARRNNQFNRARIHEKAADVLFDLMSSRRDVEGPLRSALEFSRNLNQRFTSGPVADILGLSRGQTRPTGREQPLAGLLRGPEAGAAVSAIRAAGQSPASEAATADFVLSKFQNEVIQPSGDRLTVDRLRRWRQSNRALLSRFPEIDKALQTTEGAQLIAERRLNELGQFDTSVRQAQHGMLRRFLAADPTQAVSVALGGDQPARFSRELVRLAKDDKTGNAFKGLQRGYFEDVMGNVIDQNNNLTLGRWNRYFTRKRLNAFSEVFTPTQMRALSTVKYNLQRAQRSAQRMPGGSDTVENASMLTLAVFRLAGAGLARRVTNTLQGAAFGATAGQNMARALENPRKAMLLVERAVMEPEVMRDLLRTRTRRDAAWENRINGYLADLEDDENA